MKRVFFFVILIAVSFNAKAQRNIFKTDPISTSIGNFNIVYERAFGGSSSITVGMNAGLGVLGNTVYTFGGELGYRYYVTHKKKDIPSGFYLSPKILYNMGGIKRFPIIRKMDVEFLGGGIDLGYQWVWDSGFSLNLGVGPFYNILDIGGSAVVDLAPVVNFTIGYAF